MFYCIFKVFKAPNGKCQKFVPTSIINVESETSESQPKMEAYYGENARAIKSIDPKKVLEVSNQKIKNSL